MPETRDPDINVYDIRVVWHEDGWIYGLFCTERKDPKTPLWDTPSAVAQCGIARTKDLKNWEPLPDLKAKSPQQRNVVLLDYVLRTPEDPLRAYACVQQRYSLIEKNLKLMGSLRKRPAKKKRSRRKATFESD